MKKDMRIILTKRLLKEGLLRMLSEKTLSKISITELCEASGVNRATFYNHYETPVQILEEIAHEYFYDLKKIYEESIRLGKSNDAALEACLSYLQGRKKEIKLLFSKNAENSISGFGLDLVKQNLAENRTLHEKIGNDEDRYLYSILTAAAIYGLIEVWIVQDIDKTPAEIVALLKNTFRNPLYI